MVLGIAHPGVLADLAAPIRVSEPGESSETFSVRPRLRAGDCRNVCAELTRTVEAAGDRHGLTLPVPRAGMRIRAGPEGTPSVVTPA